MRPRLAVVLLLAGCSLIKVDVSTPETRRQEYELAARKAAAEEQQRKDQARIDAEAEQKAAIAELSAAKQARDARIQASIEAARAALAAGFSADKAMTFAARVADAEASALARDGRLDMVALWREATDHLARAAVDPPSYPAFLALTAVPRSPPRDVAVRRACAKVRPVVPNDAVLEFVAECLLAVGDKPRDLEWPGIKADLAAHRKAEDARKQIEAEAAEAARTRAKTLAFAVVPLFAGGRCQGSCATTGWTASVEGGDLEARCRFGKCLGDGWTTRLPDGSEAHTSCRFSNCNKDGWDTELTGGLILRTRCGFGDCGKHGWTLELPDGGRADTRCNGSDCFKDGWQTTFPDGRTVRCRCDGNDCREHGATCQ